MMINDASILFLSHGGGPLPLLGDESHLEMVSCLERIASMIRQPSAILVISAHWEEDLPTITQGAAPPLIYDYYGFPEESYRITYPCPGDPGLAGQIHQALETSGIHARLDQDRGFDHGLFVPLKIMFPKADIPCVQLSLVRNLDPEQHLEMGRALQSLSGENLLIIGSGFSFHNMRAFFAPETSQSRKANTEFDAWLQETCSGPGLSEADRRQRLVQWESAPFARACHPREEHLLPLHVCYGMAAAPSSECFRLSILNKKSSMYLWKIKNS